MVDFATAQKIAQEFASEDIKENELKKVFSFLCSTQGSYEKATQLVAWVCEHGVFQNTQGERRYWAKIQNIFQRYHFTNDTEAKEILGWAIRLAKYYRETNLANRRASNMR